MIAIPRILEGMGIIREFVGTGIKSQECAEDSQGLQEETQIEVVTTVTSSLSSATVILDMANSNIIFYCYRLVITYHNYDDEWQPLYQDGEYFTRREICFGRYADLNDLVLDFIQDHCCQAEIDWVYRCLRRRFPQAYREFQQTGRLRIWRRYQPNAPWARWWLQELRAHRHSSRDR